MVLGPVGAGSPSFNSIVSFAVKYIRNNLDPIGRPTPLHDAISAGAIAIRVPKRFVKSLNIGPFRWRIVSEDTLVCEFGVDNPTDVAPEPDTIICSLPPLSLIAPGATTPRLYPASNKLNTALAILQLVYAFAQAYIQYDPTIRVQGLGSPYLAAIPFLYMSFINMVANLVQGSYTHVIIIPPTPPSTQSTTFNSPSTAPLDIPPQQTNPSSAAVDAIDDSASPEGDEPNADSMTLTPAGAAATEFPLDTNHPSSTESIDVLQTDEFHRWLRSRYPQIELRESGRLDSVAYFLHYSIAFAVTLIWVALLTGFRPGADGSQAFILLGIIIDPIVHVVLGMLQRWERTKGSCRGLGAVVGVKLLAWGFNVLGILFAGRNLYQLLLENTNAV